MLKGEVHPVDQLLVEGIWTFYPKLYVTIRENPDAFVLRASFNRDSVDAVRRRIKEIIGTGLEGLTGWSVSSKRSAPPQAALRQKPEDEPAGGHERPRTSLNRLGFSISTRTRPPLKCVER
jgi:hypothetical protein